MMKTIEEVIKDAIRQGMQESSDEHLGNANIHRADLTGLIAQAQALLSQGDYLEMLNQCPTGDEVEDYLTYPLPKIEPVGYLRFISNTNIKFIHNLVLKGASPFITPYPDIPVYLAPPATSQGEPVAFVYDVMVLDKYLCKRASLAKEGENLPHGTLLYAALQATEALQKDNADLFGKVEQLKLEKAELIEYAKIICKSFGQSLIDILAIPPPKCMENE